jgi:amino acid transporter
VLGVNLFFFFIKMKYKKAQGLSMQMIIIIAILLIVLVVVIAIFAGRAKIFGTELADCKGDCLDPVEGKCPSNYAKISGECSGDKVCCLELG